MGFHDICEYYHMGNIIGQGQFGSVLVGRNKVTNQKVAIKVITKEVQIMQQRREIEVLKMCQHNNIIQLIDVFEDEEKFFIVLDFMSGKDLFEYSKRRSFNYTEKRTQEIIYQVLLGIKYLHEFGIVHRDIKLENIMMTDNTDHAVPKIVDFGLSNIIGPSNTASEPFGTLGYISPEVLKKQPYTFSCDVWSLGCTIYALLSGSLPFDSEMPQQTIRQTIQDELRFDLPLWGRVSLAAKDLIAKMLKKDPDLRVTIDQAMAHPWFSEAREKFDQPKNCQINSSLMKEYCKSSFF